MACVHRYKWQPGLMSGPLIKYSPGSSNEEAAEVPLLNEDLLANQVPSQLMEAGVLEPEALFVKPEAHSPKKADNSR